MNAIGVIEGPRGAAAHWSSIDWTKIRRHVSRLQARIVKAVRAGSWHRVRCLQRLLANSFFAKLLAVQRVSSNRGKRTAGVDGIVLETPAQKWQQAQQLNAKDYKPKPLRRIYIPKKNGKRRPLGIPTQADRAEQALELLALDPVSETLADKCSYGFRQGRSAQDAMAGCFQALCQQTERRMDSGRGYPGLFRPSRPRLAGRTCPHRSGKIARLAQGRLSGTWDVPPNGRGDPARGYHFPDGGQYGAGRPGGASENARQGSSQGQPCPLCRWHAGTGVRLMG